MKEVKIHEQKARELQRVDFQDAQTLEKLQNEPKIEVYFDRDPEQDEPVMNPDGSVGYIARCVNINGIQWQIPAEKRTEVPESVYNILKASEDIKDRYRPKPINMQRVDLGYDHLFIR